MYTIRQKQEITDRLKDESKFSKDLQLFQKNFPRSPMNRELARVNDVNRGALCGRMIYALLDVTTEEEIERNRNSENQPMEKAENETAAKLEADIKKLEKQPEEQPGEQPEKAENETVAESAEAAAAGTGEQPEKQPEDQLEKVENETVAESAEAAADGTGEQPEEQPEKQPENQLESQSAESKKKDGKKRSSRK